MIGLRRRKPDEDGDLGAPEWMVTFSDCMTLLLTFFVLLLSFSTFDQIVLKELKTEMVNSFNAVYTVKEQPRDALVKIRQGDNVLEGGEHQIDTVSRIEGVLREDEQRDFSNKRVFRINAGEIFWGRGSNVSRSGQEVLDKTAALLEKLSDQVIIGVTDERGRTDENGFRQGLAVIDYLCSKGISRERFGISAESVFGDGDGVRSVELVLIQRGLSQ